MNTHMFEREGKVAAVCISNGGIPRLPVPVAQLTVAGLLDDGHRFDEHYQPTRAVTLFNAEQLHALAENLPPFPSGSVGENITVLGLDLRELLPGVRLQVGEAQVRLEKTWVPCHAQNAETGATQPNSARRMGFFASVICEGTVRPGDAITVIR